MKLINVKSMRAAVLLAFAAAGAAVFAQAASTEQPAEAELMYSLDGLYGGTKVVKSGIVTGLSLDAETGEAAVEISLEAESVRAVSGSGVKFIGRHRTGYQIECSEHGRSCWNWNPPEETARRHHGEHYSFRRQPHRMRFHHPEAEDSCPWRREPCAVSFRLGEPVLLIYNADGTVLEAVQCR